ncbi:CapA family protein [Treponema sp.]|uniref:CapA family protein n=1 Tax=Treponema sp. TaxID=166 RepID=UPI00298E06B7|nr:CapA family protein [Treponema sp.]MCR5612375.1 CapA family protein [Treponema sp.]
MKNIQKLLLSFTLTFFIFSCASTSQEQNSSHSDSNELSLVFCGDIMAHTQNFKMNDFNLIWQDVKDITLNSDFTIANVEAPVNDEMPFLNYPNFNMNSSYPQAAIDAGVNVITLANNHTNDHFETGIIATKKWSQEISARYQNSERPVYFSGLKQDVSSLENAKNSPETFCTFSKGNFKILFFGVTQLLNTPGARDMINYYPGTKKGRAALLAKIKELREQNPCDVFILALHSDEIEYDLTVENSRELFYKQLLDSGVDILWSNHPHVVKPVEYIYEKKSGKIKKVILYSTGNTISGQRRNPHFNNPANIFDYTGDGIFVSLLLKKSNGEIYIDSHKINYITTFIDKSNNYLIKKMDTDFYNELEQNGQTVWKNYLIEREKLMREIKEIQTWQ